MTDEQKMRPLGVFDSGVGGLTVVRALQERLPGQSILYLGDTARVPYGSKSPSTVREFSREITRFLLRRQVKAVVIGCNTATAFALETLQSEFPVPIIGVIEPGVSSALAASRNGIVGVIGTRGTITSGAYQKAILARRPEWEVVAQATPLLVPFIEEGWLHHPAARLVLQDYLQPLLERKMDTLVLACTHYPLLRQLLSELCGPDVTLVDSARACAEAVAQELGRMGLLLPALVGGTTRILLTDRPPAFADLAGRFLARAPEQIEVVGLPLDTNP
jgi:glutamate racemase